MSNDYFKRIETIGRPCTFVVPVKELSLLPTPFTVLQIFDNSRFATIRFD